MKAGYKSLKLNYNGEIKRLIFPNSFDELKTSLQKLYNLSQEQIKICSISFIDDEEDKVLISNEFDFEQAKMFMEKAKINLLKIFIELSEISETNEKPDNTMKFEIINDLEKEKSQISLEHIDMGDLNEDNEDNANNKLIDDIIVQSLNDMRLSTDFAKSEVFSQGDQEFVADSHGEECRELVKNIQEKLIIENVNNNETISFDKKEEETEKLLGKKTNKEFNLYEYLMKKIKEVPPFEAMIEYIMQKRNEKKKGNNSLKELSLEKVKKSVRNQIAKSVKTELKQTKKKILATLYEEAEKHVERIFNSNLTTNKTLINKNKSTSIHANVTCDGCKKNPIEGCRYKCSICEDFDYCEECEEKNKDSHYHPFIKIRRPELQPTKIVTILEDNHINKAKVIKEKLQKVKNKFKNYADKYIQYSDNISSDLRIFFDKIKLDCPKLLSEIKPGQKFYELFECKEKKHNNQEKSNGYSINKQSEPISITKLSSKCLNNNLTVTAINNSNEVRKTIKLQNNGEYCWPKYCYFTCMDNESALKGVNVPIKVRVDPGKEINIEVCLNLKNLKENGIYRSVWQLQNEKREAFGQKVLISVDAKFTNDLKVDPKFHQQSEELFVKERKVMTCADLLKDKLNKNLYINKQEKNEDKAKNKKEVDYNALMKQLKSTYDLQGIGDNRILYALVRANGNLDMAIDNLFSGANNSIFDYHPKHFN